MSTVILGICYGKCTLKSSSSFLAVNTEITMLPAAKNNALFTRVADIR